MNYLASTTFLFVISAIATSDAIAGVALRATVAIPAYWCGLISSDTATDLAMTHLWSINQLLGMVL